MRLAPQGQGHDGDPYLYDDTTRSAILQTITADRMGTYLILRLLEMLSPEVADWVRHHSRVPQLMATPLSQIGTF